jgi:hypothetical protein
VFLLLIRLLLLPYLDDRYAASRRWLFLLGVAHGLVLVGRRRSPLLITPAIASVETVSATGRIIGGAAPTHVTLVGI